MVSLKIAPFKASFTPFKNAMSMNKSNKTVSRQFTHVRCSDEEVVRYFRDANAAREALFELEHRSWEYVFEFAVEMSRRCRMVKGGDPDMNEALEVYERWLSLNPHSLCRRFPLLSDSILLSNLYPRAQRLVVSAEALQFALAYSFATAHKKALHRVAVDKINPLGQDLLSQRQKALERIVPINFDHHDLWDWERDYEGKRVRVPSRLHLEWLCWGYTPDEKGIWECGNREFGDRLSAVF